MTDPTLMFIGAISSLLSVGAFIKCIKFQKSRNIKELLITIRDSNQSPKELKALTNDTVESAGKFYFFASVSLFFFTQAITVFVGSTYSNLINSSYVVYFGVASILFMIALLPDVKGLVVATSASALLELIKRKSDGTVSEEQTERLGKIITQDERQTKRLLVIYPLTIATLPLILLGLYNVNILTTPTEPEFFTAIITLATIGIDMLFANFRKTMADNMFTALDILKGELDD